MHFAISKHVLGFHHVVDATSSIESQSKACLMYIKQLVSQHIMGQASLFKNVTALRRPERLSCPSSPCR